MQPPTVKAQTVVDVVPGFLDYVELLDEAVCKHKTRRWLAAVVCVTKLWFDDLRTLETNGS